MKKILIIHHHGKFGGSAKSIYEYINLMKKNFNIEVICPYGSAYSFFKKKKLKIYGVKGITNFNITEIGLYKKFRLILLLREFFYFFFTIGIFFRLKKNNYDLIHLNDTNLLILTPIIKYFFDTKIICHIRTRLETNKFFLKSLIINFTREYVSKLICIDKTTYDTSFLKSKSIIIYNIFNSKKKNKRGSLKKFNVGFVGTIDFHKGIDFLFECIKEINIKNENINFVIAGNTSIKNGMLLNLLNFFKIKKNINIELDSKKKLLKNTKFIGAVNNLNKFYSNISLVVFPSRMNALGRPVIEAGFFNIPSVVCLNTNKFKDTLIHGRTGFITSFGDKKKFVNYILKFYENKKMLNKFGRNANKLFNKTHGVEKNLRLMKLTYNSSKK